MKKNKQSRLRPPGHVEAENTSIQSQIELLSALQTERARGFKRLHFAGQLENAFHDHQARSSRGTLVAMCLIVLLILIVTPWWGVHYLQVPAAVAPYLYALNYILTPSTVLIAVLAWFHPSSRHIDRLCIFTVMTSIASILAQRAIAAAHGYDVPLEYVVVAIVALVFVSRTRFWHTLPWIALATVAMGLSEWLIVSPPVDGYFRVIADCTLIVITCIGGYSHEYFMRQSWINSRLLEQRSYYDSMTDLLNRRAIRSATQRMIARAHREHCAFAIAMLDIDYFKNYNDSYGHREGDAVIQRIADLLNASARRPQDFCGRYGGEEFVIAWVDGDYSELHALAETLRRRVEQAAIPHRASPISDYVTISVGFYWVSPVQAARVSRQFEHTQEETVAWLIGAADEQLYKAKFGGRNRVASQRIKPDAPEQASIAVSS